MTDIAPTSSPTPEIESVDVVYSGGGTLVACEMGAHAALMRRFNIEGVGGTSAGSIIAAAHGAGIPPDQLLTIMTEMFSGDVLDASIFAWKRFGWHKGDKIRAMLGKYLPGPMKALKRDVRIVVCDLWTGRPTVVTRLSHPDALVADVVRASISIPVFFAAVRLEQNNARLFVDGGCAINFAHDAFDDTQRRTIGIRLDNDEIDIQPVREGDFKAYAKGLARLFMDSSNRAHLSRKRWQNIITIPTVADGLDFSLTKEEIHRRYEEGYQAVVTATRLGF